MVSVVVLSQRLELLDGYLSEFDAADADTSGSQVQWQKKKTEPWRVTEEFPAGEDSKGEQIYSDLYDTAASKTLVQLLLAFILAGWQGWEKSRPCVQQQG